jgi:hypothetical protein
MAAGGGAEVQLEELHGICTYDLNLSPIRVSLAVDTDSATWETVPFTLSHWIEKPSGDPSFNNRVRVVAAGEESGGKRGVIRNKQGGLKRAHGVTVVFYNTKSMGARQRREQGREVGSDKKGSKGVGGGGVREITLAPP